MKQTILILASLLCIPNTQALPRKNSPKKTRSSRKTAKSTSTVARIDATSFEKEVLNTSTSQTVVVDFFAPWCGACNQMDSILKETANAHKKTKFVKIDIDKAEKLADTYNIEYLPTIILFKDGKEVVRVTGNNQKKLQEAINRNI
jgi:thioredoxin 1